MSCLLIEILYMIKLFSIEQEIKFNDTFLNQKSLEKWTALLVKWWAELKRIYQLFYNKNFMQGTWVLDNSGFVESSYRFALPFQ